MNEPGEDLALPGASELADRLIADDVRTLDRPGKNPTSHASTNRFFGDRLPGRIAGYSLPVLVAGGLAALIGLQTRPACTSPTPPDIAVILQTPPAPPSSPPSTSPQPPPQLRTVSAASALDNTSVTYQAVLSGEGSFSFSWVFLRDPGCGSLESRGQTATYVHGDCPDPTAGAQGRLGVCISGSTGVSLYSRNLRFGDGIFDAYDAEVTGVQGDDFGLVRSSAQPVACDQLAAGHLPASPSPSPPPLPLVPGIEAGTKVSRAPTCR